jgi:hypothetical protein
MESKEFEAELDRCGKRGEPLTRKQRGDLMQRWREIYACRLHASTGKWKHGQFEWHVFSFKHTRALSGGRALEAYRHERPGRLFVIPEAQDLAAYELAAQQLPTFTAVYGDVYIWPPDLAWTMAFTHEENDGVGPYFSRREWAA